MVAPVLSSLFKVCKLTVWKVLLSLQMGREALEGLRFLASLPRAGTGQREGGEFSCINKQINSHLVSKREIVLEANLTLPAEGGRESL